MNNNPSMAGIASLVQSRGRNGDSMLVHMAPEEVKGLQALALAHGGQLSINPETGLYEANFLKKLLPTIIGLALAPLTAGTSLAFLGNPLVAGALVGGVEGLRTGDLGKGLMAGLGAFGGAGLGAGLSAAAGTAGSAGAAGLGAGGTGGGAAAGFVPGGAQAVQAATGTEAAKQGFFNTMGRGVQALANPAGRTAFMNAVPGGMMGVTAGGMGIADALSPEFKPQMSPEEERMYYESYGYDPSQGRFLGGQFRRGYPGYPGFAMGGQVSPPPNYSYPQANISKSNYAPSVEYTKPREVLDGYDTKIDPFTGEETFADGGQVGIGALVPPPPIIDPGPQQGMFPPPPPIIDPGPQQPMPTTPLPEEPVYATAAPSSMGPTIVPEDPSFYKRYSSQIQPNDPSGADRATLLPFMNPDRDIRYGGPGARPDYGPPMMAQTTAPQQSIEQYYQSLLAPPQQRPVDNSFANYMQGLNQFVTSPIAPPPPPPQPPQTPPSKPPGDDRVTGTGGTGTGMRYDPELGRFVPGTGSPGDQNVDLAAIRDAVSGMFPGFNMNFGELNGYLSNGGYGDTSGLNWDPVSGSFMRPGSQTVFTPPGSTDQTSLNMNQVQFNPNQFQFDPNANQFNPFVEGFDMGSLPGYNMGQGMPDMGMNAGMGQGMPGMDMPQGNLTNINQFAEPMYSGMDFGNQMGGYGLGSLNFAQGGTIQRAAAGKLITGDGDGMSDDIRANISGNQEARLADGEFVIPADVVSHLGNGSTDAGADQLHAMMDRIRKARTGRTRQAPEIDPDEYMPA